MTTASESESRGNAMRQPVLITGASGFIGARLVRRLADLQCRVFCLARASSRTDGLHRAGARVLTGDVTDRRSIEHALAQSNPATVFHLAGAVRAQRWGHGCEDFTRINVDGVEHVTASCAALSLPPALIIVSSLAATGPSPASQQRVESDPPAPVSDYGRSKLAGERAAAQYAGALPITIVRPAIVYGPGDRAVLGVFRTIARWGTHFVPRSLDCDEGNRRISLIHVDDLVEGLLLAASRGERLPTPEARLVGPGIYFLAGDEQPTMAQLGAAIALALHRKPPHVIHLPAPMLRLTGIGADVTAWIRGRPGWLSSDKVVEALAGSWTCSPGKARTHLGWSPAAPLAEQLRNTAHWYQEQGWL